MKNFTQQKSLKTQSILLLSTILLSSCLKSSYGAKTENTNLNSNAAIDNTNADDFVIAEYNSQTTNSLVNTRSLATTTNSLDFLDDVDSAEYVVAGSRLSLRLYDSLGVKLSIPSEFTTNSRFKDTSGGLLLLKLSNGSQSTNLVVHKSTGRVFITKDSAVSAISLSSPQVTSTNYEGDTQSVLRVKALKASDPDTIIYVGLVFLEDAMLAIEL